MIKTRGFSSDTPDSLAKQINNFIENLKDNQLIDIKYGMAIQPSAVFLSMRVSALVIYKEE